MNKCSSCDTADKCLQCNNNYILSTGSTSCAEGVCKTGMLCYNMSTSSDSSCTEGELGCLICTSNICSQCQGGYYLKNKLCTKCNVNCSSCLGSAANCSACSDGYYLYKSYWSSSYICDKCYYLCKTCKGYSSCTSCRDGYYYVDYWCNKCPDNCSKCTSYFNCTNCTEPYSLLNNKCLCNGTVNCNSCDISGGCKSCLYPYTLINGTCRKCPSNCDICDS